MQNDPLNIGYSTCPNDTFVFFKISQNSSYVSHFHDVETLNALAFEEKLEVTKLSFHAWLLVKEQYQLLRCGAALGRGCGPLVIAKKGKTLTSNSVIAVPGEFTTAHLLLRLWDPSLRNRVFVPFDQVMGAVESGDADAGVIIHEGRFVYQERGLACLEDLGAWWETTTGQPIPLGCIAARKSLGADRIASVERDLTDSIESAFANPESTHDYVKKYAQELSDEVTRKHIETYVNDFTLDLGDEGRAAIDVLQKMAKDAGIIK